MERSEKKFQTTLILAFDANSALSRENETKIVKITHSDSDSETWSRELLASYDDDDEATFILGTGFRIEVARRSSPPCGVGGVFFCCQPTTRSPELTYI